MVVTGCRRLLMVVTGHLGVVDGGDMGAVVGGDVCAWCSTMSSPCLAQMGTRRGT